jgi:hypothetical protein
MPKGVIGENWKGIGNSYVDDQPGYAVDCLNVMASKDGRWLRSRPGFKDAGIDTANQIMGLAVYDKVDDNNTLGWALYNGGTSPSQINFNNTTDIASIVANSSQVLHEDWANDVANSKTFQYGGLDSVSMTDSMFCFGRSWNWFSIWDKAGYIKPDDSKLYNPLVTNQGSRWSDYWKILDAKYNQMLPEYGLVGKNQTYGKPTLANISTGSLDETASYKVSYQFVTKDKNEKIVGYSTPDLTEYYVNTARNYDTQVTGSGSAGIKITLPFVKESYGKELGWRLYNSSVGSTFKYYDCNRGWMSPTHIRILRTEGNGSVYYVAEEYLVGEIPSSLWTDASATATYAWSIAYANPTAVRILDNTTGGRRYSTIVQKNTLADFQAYTDYCWYYNTGSGTLYVKDPDFSIHKIIVDTGPVVLTTEISDDKLVVEYEEYTGCPCMCWLGAVHANRMFALSSDLRTAWNGKAQIWYSMAGNYPIYQVTNSIDLGNGDIPTAAISMNGTDYLFILTDQNAYVLSGATAEAFTLSKIGSNCGCFSYKGAAKHGNRIAWFGDRELWISEGGSPLNATPVLLPKYLKAIDSTASVHSGFGCYYNGQLWYRKTAYTTAEAKKKGFVYDFDQNTVWPVDRTIEAVRDSSAATGRFKFDYASPNNSWTEQVTSDTNDHAFCLYRRTATDAPVSIGQFKLTDHAKNEYNHYDQTWSSGTTWTNVEMTRYWISPWYSMGQTNDKKIDKVRIVASPETKVNLTVEGNRDWTENTTKVPNARTVQLSGGTSEWMKLPVEVRGRYIRFRLEGVGTEKFDVKNIEFDYEVIA